MKMRKLARQIAFLLIYSSDMGQTDYQDVLQNFFEEESLEEFLEAAGIIDGFSELNADELESPMEEEDMTYIANTVSGVMQRLDAIDEKINIQAKKWTTLRMASADKNILRLGVYELCYTDETIDAPVVINEAVDLARVYGDDESYKFVNGILDAISKKQQAAQDE